MGTLNVENLKTNIEYVHHLLEVVDILCLQEHWMFRFEEPLLKNLLQGYSYHAKCSDDDDPISPLMKPKGEAGVITIWKPSLDPYISTMPDGSSRCVVIKVSTQHKATFVLNTYMPTAGADEKYRAMLDEMYELNQALSPDGNIIWAGDLNGSFSRQVPSSNDRLLQKFCKEIKFTSSNDPQPTYYHFVGNITSRIDHILTHTSTDHIIGKQHVITRHPLNLSSHDPVIAHLTVPISTEDTHNSSEDATEARSKPNWKKVDVEAYKEVTNQRFKVFIEQDGLSLPTDSIVERINDILLRSADECGAKPKKKAKRKSKYPWSAALKPTVLQIKKAYWQWKQVQKDPNHPLARELKDLHKSLRQQQRQMQAEHNKALLEDIANASVEDKQLFYRLIRKQRSTQSGISSNIEFPGNPTSQLQGWANYYEQLATAEDLPHFDNSYHKAMQLKLHLVV